MPINTLRERIESYEDPSNDKLLKKVPIIIVINGRNFRKATSLLQKPFSPLFMEVLCGTMIKLSQEIDGTTFAYSFNDKIILVVRNDQTQNTEAWFDNKIQKIVSVAASIATYEFNKLALINNLEMFGDVIFTAKTFAVPNIGEAINTLIASQHQSFHSAISLACFYELLKKHSPDVVKQTLADRSSQAKAEILSEQCGINFDTYPLPFRRGVATYRIPKMISTGNGDEIKNKLIVDVNLPLFTRDRDFLGEIFKSGRDIFRANRDV